MADMAGPGALGTRGIRGLGRAVSLRLVGRGGAGVARGSGRIINISSVIGSAGGFGQANYAAAKSGMFGLTMSLALETATKGITVNTVTPGFISTDMTAAVPPDALEKVRQRIPAGRLGEPGEVARVVEFLADPESAYITGQVYAVNGGL